MGGEFVMPPDFEYMVTPFGPFHREPQRLDLADLAYIRLAQTGMVWMWGDGGAES